VVACLRGSTQPDLFLSILGAVTAQSATFAEQHNVDHHAHDRAKATHRLKEIILAMGIAGVGHTNYDLALMLASKCSRQHAFRPKVWMHYTPAKGVWSESSASEEMGAPPILADEYSSAGNALRRDIELAAGELDLIDEDTLKARAPMVSRWIEAARAQAKGTSGSALALKATHHQKDILAQAKPMLCIQADQRDKDRDIFVCANGAIDLRTGVISPHNPDHLVTGGSPIHFNVLAECPKCDKYLAEAQPDPKVRRYLQALIGYCLTGRVNLEQIYFFKGTGRNGKGVFIETLRAIAGDYAVVASPTLILRQHNSAPHPTNLAAIRGKRWATISELPQNGELDTEVIKSITGGNKQTARKMHQDFSDFDFWAKTVAEANDTPRLPEYSPAIRSRVRLVDWPITFENREDKQLKESLKTELSGIFNWALDGAKLYYAGELENVPETVQDSTAEFWADMNTMGQWVKEKCVIQADNHTGAILPDKDDRTDSSILDLNFSQWCLANRIPRIQKRAFLSKLRLQKLNGVYIRSVNGPTWVFGLRLKNAAELAMPYEEEPATVETKPAPAANPTASNTYNDALPAAPAAEGKAFRRVN
jgi:P4 family phage/plasmid primase-like protien